MQQTLLKKNYFINGKYDSKDSVIIYTILFDLIARYFIWYNNKGGHRPGLDNGGTEVKLTLKSVNADLQETKKDLKSINADLQETKKDLKSINADLQETKKDLQQVKVELQQVKNDLRTLVVVINNINTKLDAFIAEQRKFNQYVMKQFEAHGWIK